MKDLPCSGEVLVSVAGHCVRKHHEAARNLQLGAELSKGTKRDSEVMDIPAVLAACLPLCHIRRPETAERRICEDHSYRSLAGRLFTAS